MKKLQLHRPGSGPVQPLYRQIVNDLAAQIRQSLLPPGSRVPSERELCDRYGVSTVTARRALLELTQRGAIYRQAGIGSFVADPARGKRLTLVLCGFDAERWGSVAGAMGELIGGVSEVAWRHNCALHLIRADRPLDLTLVRRLIDDGDSDGILLRVAGDVDVEHVTMFDQAAVPYMYVRAYLPDRPINCVVPADEAAGHLAVAHLASLGHRRIGFVAPEPTGVVTTDRLRSYRAAVKNLKLDQDDRLVSVTSEFGPSGGYRAAMRLLSNPQRPSAVIVGAAMAQGVFEAAGDLGLEIPNDLAVVGYGWVPEARSLRPRLTCVQMSHAETGRVAAEAVLDLIFGRAHSPLRLVIDPVLEIGQSSGAATSVAAQP